MRTQCSWNGGENALTGSKISFAVFWKGQYLDFKINSITAVLKTKFCYNKALLIYKTWKTLSYTQMTLSKLWLNIRWSLDDSIKIKFAQNDWPSAHDAINFHNWLTFHQQRLPLSWERMHFKCSSYDKKACGHLQSFNKVVAHHFDQMNKFILRLFDLLLELSTIYTNFHGRFERKSTKAFTQFPIRSKPVQSIVNYIKNEWLSIHRQKWHKHSNFENANQN